MEVAKAIRSRQTIKVLGNSNTPFTANENMQPVVNELLELAAMAPFHYACHQIHRQGYNNSIVPWRFYTLSDLRCRELLRWLQKKEIDSGKIAQMLAVADTLIIATWLPDPGDEPDQLFEPTIRNMEHLAAAGAAVQNLLLAATSRGLLNYWSSGGVLRKAELFDVLHIPTNEILLGALFLNRENQEGAVTYVKGKLHDLRGEAMGWSKQVDRIG